MSDSLWRVDSRFLLLLISVYCGLKGAERIYLTAVQLPFYLSKNLDAGDYQALAAVSSVAFCSKGIIGVLTDFYPLRSKQRKGPYAFIFTASGAAAAFVLAKYHVQVSAGVAAVLLFVCYLQIAALDILCEGQYTEIIKQNSEVKNSILSYVWILFNAGIFIGASTTGLISEVKGVGMIFWICFGLSLQTLIFIATKPFPTDSRISISSPPLEKSASEVFNGSAINQHNLSLCAVAMVLIAIGYAAIALSRNYMALFLYSLVASVLFCGAMFSCMPREVAKVDLFLFLEGACFVNLAGALDRWFVAPESCVPGGPHFTLTFYQTFVLTVGVMTSWVGLYAWSYMKRFNVRRLLFTVIIMRQIASAADLVIILRFNESVLNIPDPLYFLLIDGILKPLTAMLSFLPSTIILSELCPVQIETTAYAILVACQNFGGAFSKATGLLLIELSGITTDQQCNFEQLPRILFFGRVLLPLICLAFIKTLLPPEYYFNKESQGNPVVSMEVLNVEMQPLLVET